MRFLLVGVAALAGCAATRPDLVAPAPENGRVTVRAVAAERTGDVQPVAVAITNGRSAPLRLDPHQVFAHGAAGRIAPLPPAEAARRAGGGSAPAALESGVKGAAAGGILGTIGGAISGAIQGGIGSAIGAGAAVGAALGAITGTVAGARNPSAHVAEFESRALPATTLASGFSATGYVYYPA